MSDEENKMIKIGEETVSLGDLAGVSLDDVKELRGFSFPKGVFVWEVSTDPENLPRLAAVGEGDKAKAAILVPLKCLDVVTVSDDEFTGDQNELIGKVHRETMFLTGDLAQALGYSKAFFKDIGAPYSSALKDLIAGSSGVRFQAPITKRKDKDDTDKVYTSINRQKIKPMGVAEASAIAGQVAA